MNINICEVISGVMNINICGNRLQRSKSSGPNSESSGEYHLASFVFVVKEDFSKMPAF